MKARTHRLPWSAGVLVVAAAVGLFIAGERTVEARGQDGPYPTDRTLTQGNAAAELAQKYAPIVYVRDQREACDTRGSPYVPIQVELVFDQADIALREHSGGVTTEVATAVDGSDLYGKDDTYFLDFPGNPQRPGCRFEQDFLARYGDYTPTAYAHIAYQEGRDGFALQYWLFYYFNHWNNTHEGDWEMIQLTFDGPTPAEALSQEPSGVGYSQHGGGERSSWDDSKLTREGDRPVAFAAAGANANQFEPNVILGRGDNGTGFGCDDARRPSRRVDLTVVLMEEPTSASDEFAWLNFDGRWGERAPWEFNGPTGPNDKRAWTQPFAWQEDLRPSSIIVPSDSTLGLNAVNLFCDVVWYVSTPFARLLHLPPWVLLVGFASVIGGVAFTATRTPYTPITEAPLRRRRTFGQILTSSARIYRKNLAGFLAIGAVFVPAGLVMTAAQWLLFSFDFEDTIAHFFRESLLVKAVLALTIGNLATSIVYWIVSVSALTAVARAEAGDRVRAITAVRDLRHNFWRLARPRLAAVGIILLLTVSIVGIPVAIWNIVRWAFIEEAVLFDGAEGRAARRTSARAVDGRWFLSFWRLGLLLVVGYLTGPLVAIVLLFWSDFGVSVINLVSSVIFAGLTPFVAIAQALVYFDQRRDEGGADSPAADSGG